MCCRALIISLCFILLSGLAVSAQAGLAAYWTFDSDYSSTVHNDIYEGLPHGEAYTSITNNTGQFVRGTGALKLDSGPSSGNGTFVEISTEVADATRDKQITISAWYNYTDISGDGSDARNFVYESSPGYSLAFGLRDDGAGNRDAEWWFEGLGNDTSGPAIIAGEWNHAVMILDRDSNRAQFYHNGVLRDDIHVADTALPAMSGFNIGNHRDGDGARDFDGFIDDMAVFHGVLDADGIAGLYDGSLTPETVPVFDELPPPSPVDEPAPFVEGSWTMVVLPDTQRYCYEANSHIFNTMTQWIVDNQQARNIQLVLHEGDITDNDSVGQWTYAKTALSKLDGVAPYVLTAGNHDYHLPDDRSTLIDDFFSPSDNPLNDPAQGGILLGQYVEGHLDNAYYEMTAPDGRKLLIISLEYGPRQQVVDWANSIVSQEEFADHTAIMLT
ncbi:MAG: LamG-like jellyroll fold domain-containing protein, partial [Planctomycetota bacterium]|nr:LamG-like jellyroll fold domain-containing protein [Planctomycetota bacterium]